MADETDCENALVQAVEDARVVNGAGWDIRRGWPLPDQLDTAVSSTPPITLVRVAARVGFSRNTTRFPSDENPLPAVPPSLTVTQSGSVATFAGTCSSDQIAGVQVGTTAWVVRCGAGDTPTSIAAALATLCGGSASGATLTVSGLITAATARDGGTLRPTRQIEQGFAVTIFCSDPGERDTVAGAIDAALSDRPFLPLADGSFGRLTYTGTASSDRAENASVLKRELFYTIEYSTTIAATRTPVLFAGATIATPGLKIIGAIAPP